MAKRQKIDYNGEELSQNLKQSTGKGVDAFFPDHSTAPEFTDQNLTTDVDDNGLRAKPNNRTGQPNGHPERSGKAQQADGKLGDAEQPSAILAKEATSLIEELRHGVDGTSRPTERYSFEIYTDQKDKILEVAYRYQKRTSRRLPKSRIIREALDQYLDQILEEV